MGFVFFYCGDFCVVGLGFRLFLFVGNSLFMPVFTALLWGFCEDGEVGKYLNVISVFLLIFVFHT